MSEWMLAALLVSGTFNVFLVVAIVLMRQMVRWTMNTNDHLARQIGVMMDMLIKARNEGSKDETP
jgi:hypothetical protein